MKKVTGLYSYYENNIRRFVYTYEDSNGNIKYGVTDDVDEAKDLMVDLLRTRGYKPEEAEKIMGEKDIFNFNCKDETDVFIHIQKANKDVRLNVDDFYAVIDDYDNDKDKDKVGLFTRIKNKIANSRFGNYVKNIRFNKKFNKKECLQGLP